MRAEPVALSPAAPAGPGLRLLLLRGFELRHRGTRPDLPQACQRLVAFLALQPRPVHRLFVAGTL